MQGNRTQDMFAHVQGRFVRQISPPLQTRRAHRLWPLAALRPLENQTVSCGAVPDQRPRAIAQNGAN
jgi:hypothetical protein